jgi:hypothetical protein
MRTFFTPSSERATSGSSDLPMIEVILLPPA